MYSYEKKTVLQCEVELNFKRIYSFVYIKLKKSIKFHEVAKD